jgi:hypothetical protein
MYILCTYKYENPVLVHTEYILFICFRTDMYQYILGIGFLKKSGKVGKVEKCRHHPVRIPDGSLRLARGRTFRVKFDIGDSGSDFDIVLVYTFKFRVDDIEVLRLRYVWIVADTDHGIGIFTDIGSCSNSISCYIMMSRYLAYYLPGGFHHKVVEVILVPKTQPEETSNHCVLAKACLKALRFLKRKSCCIGFHVSAQPMPRVKRQEIGKRTLVLISA